MTEHHDREFDELRKAYRRDGGELPDAALDQRVLAAAHRAAKPAPVARRWRPGLAVAAVVILSATLVLTMRPPESTESATAAPASARPEVAAARSPAESELMADTSQVVAEETEDSEGVDTIVVTGSRVSPDASVDVENPPPVAKAELTRRERSVERASQSLVASPAVAPDLPERREQVAASEGDLEDAEETARQAATPSEPELLGMAAAVEVATPATPTDARLVPIIGLWERGETDAALEALEELLAGNQVLTEGELEAQLPETFYLAWRAQE
ncbi:MAG: hypothetical protein AAFX75_12590 [Pseudomonadota bacterium]